MRLPALLLALLTLLVAAPAAAEDGYDLWLRYKPLTPAAKAQALPVAVTILREARGDASIDAAARELHVGLRGMLGRPVPIAAQVKAGAILIGTPASSPLIRGLNLPLDRLGNEGFLIRTLRLKNQPVTVIAAQRSVGVLYGAFHYLRLVQTEQPVRQLDVQSSPKVKLRLLNHWDNLDGHVERGYAGQSLWDWWKLPDHLDPRYTDYARANASIGINGTVLNNVNAKADSLTAPYIAKAKALAGVFRPYGIKVYLSARFSAPIDVGGLKTSDPLDPQVRAWWKAKAAEIYREIPDFGGFLVKANSEGQPGPQDYKRSHADGANMLAEAVAPHGGIVMWRAFVYSPEAGSDRAAQAYTEFQPLDGKFAGNVLVQVKNGPIDFQPREPFSPLFGAMPKTPLMLEVQITKEYLGFATHLAYLAPMWEEVLEADTQVKGAGSTVAKVVDGTLEGHPLTGIAGVANIGRDRNWSGSHFDQANWYAFGRLAWDHELASDAIAREWAAQTFTNDARFVKPVVGMMMGSREAVVDYTGALGLNHLFATGHHYGPGPWVDDLERADWNPTYFHKADKGGIGFDRTARGSNAVRQYAPPLATRFSDPRTVGNEFLLYFHHLPWDHPMRSGRTLWEELVVHYDRGVSAVGGMRKTWGGLGAFVDAERFGQVSDFIAIQEKEAKWWRDASISYWRSLNGLPMPHGHAEPPLPLEHYKAISFPYAPGRG